MPHHPQTVAKLAQIANDLLNHSFNAQDVNEFHSTDLFNTKTYTLLDLDAKITEFIDEIRHTLAVVLDRDSSLVIASPLVYETEELLDAEEEPTGEIRLTGEISYSQRRTWRGWRGQGPPP